MAAAKDQMRLLLTEMPQATKDGLITKVIESLGEKPENDCKANYFEIDAATNIKPHPGDTVITGNLSFNKKRAKYGYFLN